MNTSILSRCRPSVHVGLKLTGRFHRELLNLDLQRQLLGASILHYCFHVCLMQDLSGSYHLTTRNQYLTFKATPHTTYRLNSESIRTIILFQPLKVMGLNPDVMSGYKIIQLLNLTMEFDFMATYGTVATG